MEVGGKKHKEPINSVCMEEEEGKGDFLDVITFEFKMRT